MQVAGIVRPVTSAGPDDKLLHIENFGTNEGTKFEYRFSRFSFSRSSLLFPPFLSFFSQPLARLCVPLFLATRSHPAGLPEITSAQWLPDLIYRTISLLCENLHLSSDFLSAPGSLYPTWWDFSASKVGQIDETSGPRLFCVKLHTLQTKTFKLTYKLLGSIEDDW